MIVRFSTSRNLLLLTCAMGALAGCKGAETASILFPPAPTPGSPSAMAAYYVSSFLPYEPLAANLRGLNARYTLQNNTWSFGGGGPNYQSYPIAAARIEYAHAVGLTGAGQTVAVIDDGFLTTHEVFAGKTVTSTGLLPVQSHGTGVASVIAGDSPHMIGVAPGANLHLASFNDMNDMANATLQAAMIGAVAQNNSWTFPALAATQADYDSVFLSGVGQSYLSALDTFTANGVAVFAVSNDPQTQSRLMEALPQLRPSLETGWLAVGNAVPIYDSNRILSAQMISSGCLQAARWCLVADGAWESADAASNTAYGFGTGSSYATPQVSGALALLAEAFPTLTPHDLRLRLLASADNSFFTPDDTVELATGYSHGFSNTFGHGFLDLRAALLPIGPSTVDMPGAVQISATSPAVVTGAAFGDAVTASLQDVDVAVRDALNGGFSMPATALVASAAPAPQAPQLLAETAATDLTAARVAPASVANAPFRGFAGNVLDLASPTDGLAASILMPSGDAHGGIAVRHTFDAGGAQISVGLKAAQDAGSLFGFGNSSGVASDLMAVELAFASESPEGSFLSLGGELGQARLGRVTALQNVSDAQFTSVRIEAGQRNIGTKGDRLTFGIGLPAAVSRGSARMALPVMTASGAATLSSVPIDLAPENRQIDLSIAYQVPVGPGQEVMLKLAHAENYGNRAGVRDTAFVAAYTFRF